MLTAITVIALANAAAAQPQVVEGPIKMTTAETREYNSRLKPSDPHFIKCVREEGVGLVPRRTKVCRTNREWARIEDEGNRNARETAETLNKGWSSSYEPAEPPERDD